MWIQGKSYGHLTLLFCLLTERVWLLCCYDMQHFLGAWKSSEQSTWPRESLYQGVWNKGKRSLAQCAKDSTTWAVLSLVCPVKCSHCKRHDYGWSTVKDEANFLHQFYGASLKQTMLMEHCCTCRYITVEAFTEMSYHILFYFCNIKCIIWICSNFTFLVDF